MCFHDILWTVQKKLSSFRKQEEKQNWKKYLKDYIHVSTTPHPLDYNWKALYVTKLCFHVCAVRWPFVKNLFYMEKKNNDVFLMIPCMCCFFFCQCNRLCNIHKKFFSVTKYICKVLLFGVCKTSHLIRI